MKLPANNGRTSTAPAPPKVTAPVPVPKLTADRPKLTAAAPVPTILVDSREQLPLPFTVPSAPATLATADYSARGLERIVALERKELSDLLACVGRERERFEREIQRMLAYPVRAIVVESSWQELEAGQWRGKVTPAAAVGSCLGWIAAGVPVVMVGTRQRAAEYIERIIVITHRRRWRELRKMAE